MKEKLQEIIKDQCSDVTLYGVGEKSGVVAKNMIADPTLFVAKVLDVIIDVVGEKMTHYISIGGIYGDFYDGMEDIYNHLILTKEQLLSDKNTE